MLNSNYTNRLFGRTRGRSKKKINLKNYYKTVEKFKLQNFNEKFDYILDIGTGYGETSIFLANKFIDKIVISCEKYIDGNINLVRADLDLVIPPKETVDSVDLDYAKSAFIQMNNAFENMNKSRLVLTAPKNIIQVESSNSDQLSESPKTPGTSRMQVSIKTIAPTSPPFRT